MAIFGLGVYQAWWTVVFAFGGLAVALLTQRQIRSTRSIAIGSAGAGGRAMKLSVVASLLGMLFLTLGIFVLGGRSYPINLVAFVAGLGLLSLGVALLAWLGWQGSDRSWLIAALPAAILTWTVYELVRQTPPYLPIGILGEYTAPLLSTIVAVGLVAVGWFRLRSRDKLLTCLGPKDEA